MADKIGFVGYEMEDMIFYLAYCIYECGKKVAIEDRTEHAMLLRFFDAEEEQIEKGAAEVICQGIYLTNARVSEDEFDVICLAFGYRLQHPKLYECNKLVAVTDLLPAHACLLKKIGQWERTQVLVIRNCVPVKHRVDYIEKLTGVRTKNVLQIPWEAKDVRIRCSLGVGAHIRIRGLSDGMLEALEKLFEIFKFDSLGQTVEMVRKREQRWER
ncbi:MAG: hypothetical protein E7260_00335 [Lachnospiraceae bacterium]|nr:hypothetical protein [Lachnospiraceae bacterium]